MNYDLIDLIRQHCRPLSPIASGLPPRLRKLPGVRVVLFDIYGTLLISASGDVGLQASQSRAGSLRAAVEAVGLSLQVDADSAVVELQNAIVGDHARARAAGIEYSEVDIVEIWRRCLPAVVAGGSAALATWSTGDFERFAVEYEVRVNPVWPMPGLLATLEWLRDRSPLGIISNAQFFTPLLFPALVDQSLTELGCQQDLMVYSYQSGHAKPGVALARQACSALTTRKIRASEVLFVGNDMLNDVAPAAEVGFHTALFAGDKRSLRLREDDKRVVGIEPSVVLTELSQLRECLG